jgi:hypothetical protein
MEPVFVEGTYCYRHAFVLAFSLLFGSIGLFMSGVFVQAVVRHEITPESWPKALLFAGLTAVFLFIAFLIAWLFIFRRVVTIRIDGAGIRFGRRFFPWSLVASIYSAGKASVGSKSTLIFHLRSRWPWSLIRHLPLQVDEEQCDTMLDRLEQFLAGKFPHVHVG